MIKSLIMSLLLGCFSTLAIIGVYFLLADISLGDLFASVESPQRVNPTPSASPTRKQNVAKKPSLEGQSEARCVIDSNQLVKALKQHLDNNQLESELISIITKLDDSSCPKCSKQDKKIILQIKMMQALKDGKRLLADKYMKQLDRYVN